MINEQDYDYVGIYSVNYRGMIKGDYESATATQTLALTLKADHYPCGNIIMPTVDELN